MKSLNNKQTISESKREIFDEFLGEEKIKELKEVYKTFMDSLSKSLRTELDRMLM